MDIVDVADRGKLEGGEGAHIRQIPTIEIDVRESDRNEERHDRHDADQDINDTALPSESGQADTTNARSRRQRSATHAPRPGRSETHRSPARAQIRSRVRDDPETHQ